MSKLIIDLGKIRNNCKNIIRLLNGIEVVAVTKGCASDAKIVKALIASGIKTIADTSAENLASIKTAGVKKMYLKPAKTLKEISTSADFDYYAVCTNEDILFLSSLIKKDDKKNIVLMLETGFGREGFNENEIVSTLDLVEQSANIDLVAIGTNTPCRNGDDLEAQMLNFSKLKHKYFSKHRNLIVSGGNSSLINLAIRSNLAGFINQLRIGEAILLGHDTTEFEQVPGCYQDAFVLKSRISEVRKKNSINQALALTGVSEFGAGSLKPLNIEIEKIDAIYSDFVTLRFKEGCSATIEEVSFLPDYYALLSLFNSKNIEKVYLN